MLEKREALCLKEVLDSAEQISGQVSIPKAIQTTDKFVAWMTTKQDADSDK